MTKKRWMGIGGVGFQTAAPQINPEFMAKNPLVLVFLEGDCSVYRKYVSFVSQFSIFVVSITSIAIHITPRGVP